MASATITVTGNITGLASGTKTLLAAITSALANGQTQQLALASGANTITVPTAPAPSGCLIILPSDNTVVTTLKGVTGDTGIAIGKVGFILLTWDPTAPPASFVLTAASAQTGKYTEITFF
jgi:hypothetical protein